MTRVPPTDANKIIRSAVMFVVCLGWLAVLASEIIRGDAISSILLGVPALTFGILFGVPGIGPGHKLKISVGDVTAETEGPPTKDSTREAGHGNANG